MKPTERVLEVDSTLTGESVRMAIDESAIQHIIGVLTDLYSDPELAVIREYSTNALDAHREAGNSAPIEVTLPSPLAPFFRVKDYGIGLDAEGIRNIYSRYGASTKRDSDEQVGMLGLGAKSALTYTDQFTLIGTKGGRTVQVQIGRDEDGGGSMTIVSDEPSDEPNGVEIIVPAKRSNAFESKAYSFFRFWDRGTVLVNGEEPENIRDAAEPTWLIPDKLFVYSEGRGHRYSYSFGWVVMGNVAYPMPEESNGRNYGIVAFVEIGEVNFTPSREALMLTKRTKETLARIEADVERELASAAQKRVAGAATPSDAIRFAQEAAAFGVKTEGLKYQGRDVPKELDRRPKNTDGTTRTINVFNHTPENSYLVLNLGGGYPRKNGERYDKIPPYNSNRLVFTGFDSKEFSLPKREKLNIWLEEQKIDRREIVAVDKLSADESFWLTGTPIHPWEDVQAIKLERTGSGSVTLGGKPRGSYELVEGGHIQADEIDTSKPLLWIRPDERMNNGRWRPERLKHEHYDPEGAATVIVLPANRRDKFERDFPHAEHWRDWRRAEATKWLAKQCAEALEAAKFQMSGQGSKLAKLDHTRVKDPALAEAIRKQNEKVEAVKAGIEKRRHFIDDLNFGPRDFPDPLDEYPLASDTYHLLKNADHFYLYVNAAYADHSLALSA